MKAFLGCALVVLGATLVHPGLGMMVLGAILIIVSLVEERVIR